MISIYNDFNNYLCTLDRRRNTLYEIPFSAGESVQESYFSPQIPLFEIPEKPVLDLAECLTKLGFANVTNHPTDSESDKNLQKYFQNLIKLQNKAKRTRTGLWAEKIPPPRWPVNVIQKYVTKAILSALPQNRRLPELVR